MGDVLKWLGLGERRVRDGDVKVIDSDDEEEIRRLRMRRKKRKRSTSFKMSEREQMEEKKNNEDGGITGGGEPGGDCVSINSLSNDILVKIFLQMKRFPEFCHVLPVCKRWREVGKCPRLWTTLSFEDYEHVTDATLLQIFQRNENMMLKSLSLSKCHRISSEVLREILATKAVSTLEHIDLSWCSGANSKHSIDFSNCPNLKSVNLAYNRKVPGIAIRKLVSNCHDLEELDLRCCKRITNKSLFLLAENCTRLRKLNIAYNNARNVTNSGICAVITKCADLEEINISSCRKISDATLEVIANRLPKLRVLGLSGTKVTNNGVQRVVESCPLLEELLLANCSISDVGAVSIARYCQRNLKTLNLASCYDVTDYAVYFLLVQCKALTNLDVSKLPCRHIVLNDSMINNVTVYY